MNKNLLKALDLIWICKFEAEIHCMQLQLLIVMVLNESKTPPPSSIYIFKRVVTYIFRQYASQGN